MPPYAPQPHLTDITTSSAAFTWDPVIDQGDGAGRDFFASGMDHYTSWLTLNGSTARLQLASSTSPRSMVELRMTPGDTACIHVIAFDKLQNASPQGIACAGALSPPPMPAWSWAGRVAANPNPVGLVGLDSWFWLSPTPASTTVEETYRGLSYAVTATPAGADWDFGDGTSVRYIDASGFGQAYPQPSGVVNMYQAHREAGYRVQSSIRFGFSWNALVGGRSIGPYPLDPIVMPALPLEYPVEQAEPELVGI